MSRESKIAKIKEFLANSFTDDFTNLDEHIRPRVRRNALDVLTANGSSLESIVNLAVVAYMEGALDSIEAGVSDKEYYVTLRKLLRPVHIQREIRLKRVQEILSETEDTSS